MKSDQDSSDGIPIAHEELRVAKTASEVGRVAVRTSIDERMAWVHEELAREDVQVEWVDVNRQVEELPEIRTEGDTLIIPLFEEVLVRRLVIRQELRLTRRITTRAFERDVPLRAMRAEVQRKPPAGIVSQPEEYPMRTLTALYDTREHAERARQDLLSAGLAADDVTVSDAGGDHAPEADRRQEGGFMQSMKNFFMPDEDREAYREGVSRGGFLLCAHVPEGHEDRAMQILDTSGAVDFDARQAQWRGAGWTGASRQSDRSDHDVEADRDVTIPIAEERLAVGKREVDRGSVRVRSYVTEKPVHEQVNLREEHVNVERRPVNERIQGAADGIFEERSFEVVERAEEAVVSKETVVTDELHLSKEATERTEDIEDTVRRTDVDVDDSRGRAATRDDQAPRAPRDY